MMMTILTILATVFLHGSSIPQFVRNYKRKSTEDISIPLWVMVFMGYVFLLTIALIQNVTSFIVIYVIGVINIGAMITQVVYYRIKK